MASLNLSGIESIAFRPNNGTLFGATETGLCTIDPTTGQATYIGDFGNPYGLNLAQNIRFDSDGNLYLSNTSEAGTDIYQVNTGRQRDLCWRSRGYSNLILENGSQYMYGVSIPAINGANAQPVLVSFDLSSFVDGGTNADGSIHQIAVTMVGAGADFPVNFNFSGSVPNPLPVNIPDASTVSIAPQPDGNGHHPGREHQPDVCDRGLVRHAQLVLDQHQPDRRQRDLHVC